MFGIGTQELMIIFLIVLLLFGASRIPEIGRALGKGIRDFKRATQDLEEDFKVDEPSARIEDTATKGTSTETGSKQKTH